MLWRSLLEEVKIFYVYLVNLREYFVHLIVRARMTYRVETHIASHKGNYLIVKNP